MTDSPQLTPREQSRLAVRRLTKLLAAISLAATAAFGAAAASATSHGSNGSTEDTSGGYVESDSWDEDFGFAPSQGVWSTNEPPAATSGGS